MKKHLLLCLLVLSMIFALGVLPVNAVTLKFAYVAPIGTINHDVGVKFKETLTELSGGQIDVKLFPGGQLGNLPQLFGQLKKGAIDLFKTDLVVAGIIGGGKSLSVLAAPHLFRDQAHFESFSNSEIFNALAGEIETKNGIKWVGLLTARSPRAITTRNKMVLTPDDLKGQKIRAPKATNLSKVIEGFGASVAILPASEIYTGLKQKVVDGQENGLDVVYGMKLYEVQKYYIATDHMLSAECLWMNQKSWKSLSAAQQEMVIKAAKAARDWGNKELNTKILEWFELCRQNGMTIVMPPLDAWKKQRRKLLPIWTARYGPRVCILKFKILSDRF